MRLIASSGPDSSAIDCPETSTGADRPWGKTTISAMEVTSLAVAFPSSKKRSPVAFGQSMSRTSWVRFKLKLVHDRGGRIAHGDEGGQAHDFLL